MGDAPKTETPLHWMRGRRSVPAPVERALSSALSRGSGYEDTPLGRRFERDAVGGYYIDYSAKTLAATASGDLDQLPPVPVIQLALGWWERHLAGEPEALAEFVRLCGLVADRGEPDGDQLLWPTRVPIAKHQLTPPWNSALPQGQAASAFVRAHLATGEDRWAGLASRAVAPLLVVDGSDIVTQTGEGPILEEAPSNPGSHVLNGWISAIWGVRDVALGLGDERAGSVADASLRCLRSWLPAYDTGWWSRYSLYPHALEDLSKPIYHRFHVAQLTALHEITGDPVFGAAAERWAGYDRAANRLLAVAQKAAFVAVDGRRRRRWRPAGGAEGGLR